MITVNNLKVETELFPNGESLIHTEVLNQLNKDKRVRVDFKWGEDGDILKLIFVLEHLNSLNITKRDLYIQYMPYSRMDRNENGNCFTLHHLCKLIKTAITDEDSINVVEPHSDVTLNELGAKRINLITPLVQRVLSENQDIDVICYPDKGAKARFKDDTVDKPVVYCEKVRDFDTGIIKGLTLVGDIDLTDKNVLIVDDLCSKGGTFFYTAQELKKHGVKNIYLVVCHMESTIRYGKILNNNDLIKHIYATDSMLPPVEAYWVQQEKGITLFDLSKYLQEGVLEVQKG